MQISANITTMNLHATYQSKKTAKSEKSGFEDVALQMRQQSFNYSYVSFEIQGATAEEKFTRDYEEFQNFLEEIGYTGGPIAELTQDEASELVSEEGFFGISQTAERIANFVLNGAGENESLLRAGRSGILQGFKEAEELWGGKLPDISYKTIEKAVEIIDTAMHEMGYNILEETT